MSIRNNFKTIIIILGLFIYLYLFIVGINSSKQIEALQFEKQNLNKENDKSTNKLLQYIDENKSLNQTIYSLQYTIDEFRKNFAKSEIQFENELNVIQSQLSQCNNQSNFNKNQLSIIKNKYNTLLNNSYSNSNNNNNNNNSNSNSNSNSKNYRNNNYQNKQYITINSKKEIKIDEIIPIVIPTCNRIEYLEKTLESLIAVRKDKIKFPIIVSQDCNNREMYAYLESLSIGDEIITIRSPNRTQLPPYQSISRHYKWFIGQMFDKLAYDKIIIVEDDLVVSPDFYEYFEAMSPLLDIDQSLFCISAWNDNGKKRFVNPNFNQSKLTFHRTDFFPGLGWMLKNSFWKEIKSGWPAQYWDDYLRKRDVFKGRQCIRPELPRVKNIGESGGATNSQVYENYIKALIYNQDSDIDYKSYNINQLLEPGYSNRLKNQIENAQIAQLWEIDNFNYTNRTLRIIFNSPGDYNTIAIQLKLIEDDRDEIQRTSFKKIVQFYYKSNLVYLTPKDINW